MGYSQNFPSSGQALDEEAAARLAHEVLEAARLAPANDVAEDNALSPAVICETLSTAGHDRMLHVEYVLIAAVWLGSVGLGLYRLLL